MSPLMAPGAIRAIEARLPDVVILDYAMPGIVGPSSPPSSGHVMRSCRLCLRPAMPTAHPSETQATMTCLF